MSSTAKVVVGVIVGVALLGGAFGIGQQVWLRTRPGVGELSPYADEYAALAEGARKATPKEVQAAVQDGVLIAPVDVTDPGDPGLDAAVFDALPEAERPTTDAEVTAVALLRYWEEETQKDFVDEYCRVVIVDRATGRILARTTLAAYSAAVRVGTLEERGELAPSEIADFLTDPSRWSEAAAP
jgi:hypothetical protein